MDDKPPDELAAWLTQVLDDDQASAEACDQVYPSPWELHDRGHTATVRADAPNFWVVAELEQHPSIDGWLGDRLAHIAQNDPATVLARIAAHRKILALHHPDPDAEVWDQWLADETALPGTRRCDGCGEQWHADAPPGSPPSAVGPEQGCLTVRLLALPHAGRPGYREEWRP